MWLPRERWLKLVFFSTAAVFLGVVLYLYGLRFFRWIESDASVTALLAARAIAARSPVVSDWYYANGDIWVFSPHLLAILPVAISGVGPASLLAAVVSGFVLELVALIRIYARLGGERWLGVFAAMVTLMAWSRAHVGFVYIQLGYGFVTVVILIAFAAFANLVTAPPARPWRWGLVGAFIALVAIQNPSRALAFLVAPAIVGALWPWRGLALRRRIAVVATAAAGYLVASVIYARVLTPFVHFSVPSGFRAFVVKDWDGMVDNLAMLGRGLMFLCGALDDRVWPAIPGGLVMAGALIFVGCEVFGARAVTALRFVAVVIAAQLAGVLLPLLIGNLLLDAGSARYLMPSLLTILGLAAILAVRALSAGRIRRWLAAGWLVLLPLTALVAVPNAQPPVPVAYTWPSVPDLNKVRDAVRQRGLTRGYANVLAANILDLEAHGALVTCPVYFAHVLIPQRWLTDTSCYTRSALPERFFVLSDHDPRDEAALRATLPEPIERFHAGKTYDVSVYRTADASFAWLELPFLPDGQLPTLPLRLPATHLALHRREVRVDGDHLVATGAEGFVVYGPYIRLAKGDYTLTWIGSRVDSAGELAFTVDTDFGKDVLARAAVAPGAVPAQRAPIARLQFSLDRTREVVEFPIASTGGARVALDEVILERR